MCRQNPPVRAGRESLGRRTRFTAFSDPSLFRLLKHIEKVPHLGRDRLHPRPIQLGGSVQGGGMPELSVTSTFVYFLLRLTSFVSMSKGPSKSAAEPIFRWSVCDAYGRERSCLQAMNMKVITRALAVLALASLGNAQDTYRKSVV